MPAILKLVFQEPRLRLALKSTIFGASLFFIHSLPLAWWSIMLTAVWFFVFFFSNRKPALGVLLLLALAAMQTLESMVFIAPTVAVSTLIYFLLVGRYDVVLVRRLYAGLFGYGLLLYALLVFFFASEKSQWFLLKFSTALMGCWLVLYEWLNDSMPQFPKRKLLAAWVGTVLIGQCMWAVALLPIGMLNSANLMIPLIFVIGYGIYLRTIAKMDRK